MPDAALGDHDGDNAGTGLSRSEVSADGLLHGEPVAFIAAKTNGGRGAVLHESDKRDLHRRPIVANDRSDLDNADQPANAGGRAGKSATDEDVPASSTDQDQANRQKGRQKGFQGAPPKETKESLHPEGWSWVRPRLAAGQGQRSLSPL